MPNNQRERELDLSDVEAGTVIAFSTGENEFKFRIHTAGPMPLGILRDMDSLRPSMVQLLGVIGYDRPYLQPNITVGVLTDDAHAVFVGIENEDGVIPVVFMHEIQRYEVCS